MCFFVHTPELSRHSRPRPSPFLPKRTTTNNLSETRFKTKQPKVSTAKGEVAAVDDRGVNKRAHGRHIHEEHIRQHERTAAFIAGYFADDVAFMEAGFGADQGIDEVTPTLPDISVGDAGWMVDLGGITVEAQYHGFGQTDGDLFVYVPQAEVMWTGNPIVASAPGIPWLLDGHAADVSVTLKAVQASLPPGAIVIPGHGRPATVSTFDFSIDYLDTLIPEVQASVDAGDSQAETQAAVVMTDHQGYALWDWVHTTINVPQTYAELSQ